jgi:cold shock protein
MAQGKVKTWNDRGFGFILPERGGVDVFVHVTEVKKLGLDSLVPGERVEFTEETDSQGRSRAVNVRVL